MRSEVASVARNEIHADRAVLPAVWLVHISSDELRNAVEGAPDRTPGDWPLDAKITCQHALIYRHLIDTFDLDVAKRYAETNRSGAGQIAAWIDGLDIACDFESKDAYTYTAVVASKVLPWPHSS